VVCSGYAIEKELHWLAALILSVVLWNDSLICMMMIYEIVVKSGKVGTFNDFCGRKIKNLVRTSRVSQGRLQNIVESI
jgi:hypothetical protein